MSKEHVEGLDPRTQGALDELRRVIEERYPGAQFDVAFGHDEPKNVHLMTAVDLDDPDEVLDLVIDRLVELQVEERIPVYVIPLRTPERRLAALRAEQRPERTVRRIISASHRTLAPGA